MRQEPEVAHLASVYLRWASLGLPAYAFNAISRRYFQSQGRRSRTYLTMCLLTLHSDRPIRRSNTYHSWRSARQRLAQLPARFAPFGLPCTFRILTAHVVWGPEPIRLGFIGAPIATAVSFNLISLMSIIYGVFFVPQTAWHPLTMRCFTSLGVLVQLGLSGVGQVASEWWSWELVACEFPI